MEIRDQPSHCDQDLTWGDHMNNKTRAIRLMFQNINGLPYAIGPKDSSIMSEIQSRELDFLGMAEVNLNWYRLDSSLSLRSRTKGWFDLQQTNYSNNTKLPWHSSYQRGGTASIITGKLVSHIVESSKDNLDLGRWCISRLRGTNNTFTTVITAYRPVPSNEPGSTFIQQQVILNSLGINVDPREQFLNDLRVTINGYIDKGDQIIVMLDANSDVRSGVIHEFFQSLHLTEIISFNHGSRGPSTMSRNSRSIAIDGIFVSPSLTIKTNCGYLDFTDGVSGADHRAIWVEFPSHLVLGQNRSLPTQFKARRLQCSHPEVVRKFEQDLAYYLHQIDFDDQVLDIIQTNDKRQCTDKYNRLIHLHYSLCQLAEEKCRKLRMGAISYSPELSKSILTITLWRQVSRRISGSKNSLRYIQRLAKKVGIVVTPQITIQQAKSYLSEAIESYRRTVKPNGTHLRESFILSRIHSAETDGDTKLASHYFKLLDTEKIREVNRRLNYITRSQSNRIQYITGQNSNGTMITADKREEMEEVMQVENYSRFTQSKDTPFLSAPLLPIIGSLGISTACDDIVNGTFVSPPDLSIEIRELLNQCSEIKLNDGFDYIHELLNARVDTGWKHMKERISTSPFGLHVGHLKSIFSSPSLMESHRRLSLIPVLYGLSPPTFCKATNIFIEKKEGVREVSSLRTIVLYDAIFNMNNKLIAKIVMDRAEKLKAIAIEQYGCRKNKSAPLQTLNKRLIFDSLRQSRIPTVVIGNDMKSAYDRIVHSVAALSLRRVGVPQELIVSLFEPLQRMHHHTRTIFGDSENSFTSGDSIFHGVGQGNGAGPMIWSMVSSVIFASFRKLHGSGINLPKFKGYDLPIVSGLAFVDDVDLFVMGDHDSSIRQVIAEAQKRLTTYESLIRSTGGAINPTKSYIYYAFPSNERNSLVDHETITSWSLPTISCKDHLGRSADLPIIPVDVAQRTLGVYLSPSSNQSEQINQLISISTKWADHIRMNKLSRKDILYALETRYYKQVGYPLISVSLSRDEANRIMSPLLKTALPKMGLLRSFPRVILFGPSKYHGLQMKHLFTESLISQLSILLASMYSSDLTSTFLKWSMRCTVYETGFKGPIYRIPPEVVENLATPSWFRSLFVHLSKYSITIEDDITNDELKRIDDFYIMEYCHHSGMRIRDLIHVNLCRLYLGVTTASDILSGCGKYIMDWVWEGINPYPRVNLIKYHRPSEKSWRIWRSSLRRLFGQGKGRCLPVQHHLGSWKLIRSTSNWYCFVDRSSQFAYIRENDEWVVFRVNRKFRQGYRVRLHHVYRRLSSEQLPPLLLPASIHTVGNATWLTKGSRDHVQPPTVISRSPFSDRIAEYQSSAKSPLPDMQVDDQAYQISRDILNCVAWGASDGSYSNDIATAAFCINPSNNLLSSRLVSVSAVPGEKHELSAYRSELWGLYTAVLAIYIIVDTYQIQSGSVTLFCDNQSSIRKCSDRSAHPNSDHYDILSAIYHLMNRMKEVTIKFMYVRGHQDRLSSHLSPQAISNIEMDNIAQELRKILESHSFRAFSFPIPVSSYAVYSPYHIMTGPLNVWIRETIHGNEIKTFWANKGRINQVHMMAIDWQVIESASTTLPVYRRWAISKFISGFSGVGKWLHRFDPRLSSNCPFCQRPNETTEHVLKCQSERVTLKWNQELDSLSSWLDEHAPHPSIKTIVPILRWWRDPNLHLFPTIPPDIQTTITAQSNIGWKQFLEGLLSVSWSSFLEDTSDTPNQTSRYKGRRFLKALVIKLYQISFDMWQYRNDEKHRINDSDRIGLLQVNQVEIRNQFLLGNPTRSDLIRRLLRKGIAKTLKLPFQAQNIWIASIQSARAQPLNEENVQQQNLSNMQSTFRRWLRSYSDLRHE